MDEYNNYAEALVEELQEMQKSINEMRDRVLGILKPLVDDNDPDWWTPQGVFGEAERMLESTMGVVKRNAALLTLPSTRFYEYRQNNSGGDYIGPIRLIIEAPNYVVANEIAEKNGVYWNGVRDGKDCPCCGDRWSSHDDEYYARFKIDPIDDRNAKIIYLNR
jgi:hypothetical protein